MKTKLLLSAGMLFIALSASAQFVNSSTTGNAAATSDLSSYSGLYFQYNPQTMYFDGEDESGANGYLLGYFWASPLTSSTPIFLEGGLAFQYAKYDDNGLTMTFTEFKLPFNFSYRYQVQNSKVTIAPYLGLTLKVNTSGKLEIDGYSGDADFFDEDDMGKKDYTANRLQLAWQIGANVDINKVRLGIGYGKDLTEYMDYPKMFPEMKFGSLNLTLGVLF